MPYEIGVQSFTYREFTLPELCTAVAETPVTAVELCDVHVDPTMNETELAAAVERLAAVGLDVCGYGVVDLDPDTSLPPLLEFVSRIGAGYVSVDVPPDADDRIRELIDAAAAWGLDVAIHNHGPESRYVTVDDVLTVLRRHPDPRLGACVDVGHYLRADQSPATVIPRLGDRVLALHLKDFDADGREAVPGSGQIDLAELGALLETHTSFHRPLVIEYEADPEEPTPAVAQAARAIEALG